MCVFRSCDFCVFVKDKAVQPLKLCRTMGNDFDKKKTYCPYALLTRVRGDLHCRMYIQYTYFYVALHAGSPGLYLYNLVITIKNSTFTREGGGREIFSCWVDTIYTPDCIYNFILNCIHLFTVLLLVEAEKRRWNHRLCLRLTKQWFTL